MHLLGQGWKVMLAGPSFGHGTYIKKNDPCYQRMESDKGNILKTILYGISKPEPDGQSLWKEKHVVR